MLKWKKEKCTAQTVGTITKFTYNEERHVHAEYVVDGFVYKHAEQVRYLTEPVKVGKVPIGRKGHSNLGGVGDDIIVMYDSNNPKRSYFPENIGKLM